jgi:hypothetical protein
MYSSTPKATNIKLDTTLRVNQLRRLRFISSSFPWPLFCGSVLNIAHRGTKEKKNPFAQAEASGQRGETPPRLL